MVVTTGMPPSTSSSKTETMEAEARTLASSIVPAPERAPSPKPEVPASSPARGAASLPEEGAGQETEGPLLEEDEDDNRISVAPPEDAEY